MARRTPHSTSTSPPLSPSFLQGTLRGFDQATNLILDDCHERVYSSQVCLLRERERRRGFACAGGMPGCESVTPPHPPRFSLSLSFSSPRRLASSRCPWPASRSSGAIICACGRVKAKEAGGRVARHVRTLQLSQPFHLSPPPFFSHLLSSHSAIVGELDVAADAGIDLDAVRAPPLRPVTH